jgi:hypothetical protein
MSHRWTLRRVRRLYSRFSARWVVVEDLRPGPMAIRTTMRRARFVHADPAILLTARLPRTRAATTSSRVAEVLLEGVGAGNGVVAGHAAFRYSWMSPSQRVDLMT